MIGPKPTLEDIVLDLQPLPQPESVDLMCYEQLSDSSEDEDEVDHHHNNQQQHHQHARPAGPEDGDCFRIVSDCYSCSKPLRLVVVSSHEELRVLEQLLMGTLEIVCPSCAGRV
ncbi:E7 [Rhesus papillomavirus 1b]|uniref:Protein E7 n=1 Tax=Rhesus papillomavirus 1b TaxID=464935 RepID=D0QMD0_RHPV1|nr:E7 [Rhesus papillomavirus 1b]